MDNKFVFAEFLVKNKEMMEVVSTNISDVIVNFQDYSSFEGDTLENHMNEFSVVWLEGENDSASEYVVASDCEVLFDGLKEEKDAEQVYQWLYERAHELANEVTND